MQIVVLDISRIDESDRHRTTRKKIFAQSLAKLASPP
jgi:hypothetical protein